MLGAEIVSIPTLQEICALLDPYDSSIVSSTLVKEEDKTVTAHVK